MAVNENVYGAADIWFPSFFNPYITNKNKLAVFYGTDSCRLYHGVDHNKLSYNEPIDKSLSYCGLGAESALSHIGYIYKVNGTYAVREWQDTNVTNFAFFQQNVTSLDMSASPGRWYFDNDSIYHTLDWKESGSYSYNCQKNLQPYTLINPLNQVLCIYVKAYNTDTSSPIYCDWSTYKNTYKTSYPNIANVDIVAYFNNSGWTIENPIRTISGDFTNTLNENQRTLSYGRLDSYVCKGKDFEMYCYYLNSLCVLGSASVTTVNVSSDHLLFVFATEICKEHVKIIQLGNNINAYIEYFDGIEDEIFKTVACFGLYFTPNENIAKTGLLTNNDMYIGLLDENGIGHGEYLRGADTVNAPQNEFTDMSQSGYDYTKEVDKTKYINDTQFYTTWASSAFTKMYVLRGTDVSSLANELYTAVAAAPTGEEIERYNQSVFLTQNPIDCIISLKKFPVEFFATTWQPVTPIKLGSYTCNTNGSPLPYTTGVYNFTFSNSTNNGLYPWFDKSFLDYEPYTKCELTIPFCGTVEIPTTYLHDYDTIDVKLIVDFITGACTAYIQARNITIDSVSGECAVTLPVNGIQSATLDSQIHSAATARNKSALTNGLGLIGGLAAVGIGIATGGIGTAVIGGIAALTSGANMITQDKNIEYELQHMQVPLKQVSGASGAINQSYDMRCKMRITRPKISADYDAEVYANTVGFACLINTTVNTLSGLTVGDINLDNVAASDVEKQLIKNAFAGGVIL